VPPVRMVSPALVLQVVLSTVGAAEGSGFSLGAFIGGDDAALRSPAREAAIAESGVPHTIVRAGARQQDAPMYAPSGKRNALTCSIANDKLQFC